MELVKAVKERRSVRRFIPREIPQEIIRDIMETARWSPSWANTQAWEFYVITGNALERFRKANHEKCLKGETPSPDIAMPDKWPEKWNQRYMNFAATLFDSLSIARNDMEARNKVYAEMFNIFNAPCLIVACIDKGLSPAYAMLDAGLIVQTIGLLAHDRGLGTCIEACAVMYPRLLKDVAGIPDEKNVVIGMALGYPDPDAPINTFTRERVNLDEMVTWVR
ncbi:MAG: nitroreductase [Deltaproteobacteria bacterium]|nr:nitroreductase [Deltaproteobacteria bacterium]